MILVVVVDVLVGVGVVVVMGVAVVVGIVVIVGIVAVEGEGHAGSSSPGGLQIVPLGPLA